MRNLRDRAVGSLVAAVCLVLPAAAQEQVVEVTVTGEAMSEDGALHDALRKALEQGGRVEISSHSNVENFELIRDSIYARADGIVTDYKILEKGDGIGGAKYCRIRARVRKDAIASTWGEVQNVLDQIGRPGIAVFILERIDGIVQDSSILESEIEHRLLDAGFVVHASEQIKALAAKEGADAEAEMNPAKMQAIAKDFGTQIFISGSAQANAAGVKQLAGQPTAMYNGDATIKVYYTDTAQLLASESLPNWRGGARGELTISPQAGKKALSNAGRDIVENCYRSVMKFWATRISAGGLVKLEVEGMSILEVIDLKKKLKALDPDKILNVNQSMTKGIATFRINTKMTADELLVRLAQDEEFASILVVHDFKDNRIQARKVKP